MAPALTGDTKNAHVALARNVSVQRHGPAKSFYDNSIMYLSYTPLESLSDETKYNLAHDMALAALVGDGVCVAPPSLRPAWW